LIRNFNGANFTAVFLAKQRDGAFSFCFFKRLHLLMDGIFAGNIAVDQSFDLQQFIAAESAREVEVEPQTFRVHRGTGLVYFFAQDISQSGMQQVRAGVVAHGCPARGFIQARQSLVIRARCSMPDDAAKHDQSRNRLAGGTDLHFPSGLFG